jgi:hypothetical protein
MMSPKKNTEKQQIICTAGGVERRGALDLVWLWRRNTDEGFSSLT